AAAVLRDLSADRGCGTRVARAASVPSILISGVGDHVAGPGWRRRLRWPCLQSENRLVLSQRQERCRLKQGQAGWRSAEARAWLARALSESCRNRQDRHEVESSDWCLRADDRSPCLV